MKKKTVSIIKLVVYLLFGVVIFSFIIRSLWNSVIIAAVGVPVMSYRDSVITGVALDLAIIVASQIHSSYIAMKQGGSDE